MDKHQPHKDCVPLIVFDFDHTIIDLNSDVEVQKLAPGGRIPHEIQKLWTPGDWTNFMREVFRYLNKHNITKEEILSCMEKLPLTPSFEVLIRACVEELNADVIIISDANSVFINHIIKHYNLDKYFTHIFTNFSSWSKDGLLKIEPYHHQDTCKLSNVNLCKGDVLEKYFLDHKGEYCFVAYVGDGSNDFCPMLRLRETDLAFPRKGYKIHDRIKLMEESGGLKVKAEKVFWTEGKEILDKIKEKIVSIRSS